VYKKILTTIQEEHFDEMPISRSSTTKVETAKTNPKTSENSTHKPKDIQIYNFPELKQLEKDSINYWAQLSWRIRSLVISITSGDEDVDVLELRMKKDIEHIGSLLESKYGDDMTITFNALLTAVCLSLMDVIYVVEAGRDITDTKEKMHQSIMSLAEFMTSLNLLWPTDAIHNIIMEMGNLYIKQAKNRVIKDWPAAIEAADNAYNLIVIQQDNGDPSFADIYSFGIIN